ncbi:autotransporter-associated beta strand repeat [Pedobacter glucosidilyticus]|nr:cadherin-like beta sandwich domain-containing protein [Pedobacter glucosidilyticus]KHJ37930.1 autotransporter-associated beta strand repeat [Pedobacter glucosidilyticus]
MKRILLVLNLLLGFFANAQNLSISTGGQTGTSGTNWSTSGTNPVTISFTGTANVNASVIEGYLNTGRSVIIQPGNTTNADVDFQAAINKSAGVDATLTIKSNRRIFTPTLNSTSGRLNMIVIVEADGGTSAGPDIRPASTNGGHIWVGGGGGTAIWNGLAVGNGLAYSDGSLNLNTVDLTGNLATSGGDVFFALDDTNNSASHGDLAAWNGARTINTGSGDIAFLTELADFNSSQGHAITLTTSGVLTFASPNSTNRWPGDFYWQGTLSGTTFTGTNSNATGLIINNYTSLGGLSIGTYTGTGTAGDTNYLPITNTEVRDIFINSAVSTVGPITVYGLSAYINASLTTTNNNTGDIQLKTAADIIQASGNHVTTNGGDVVYWADYDANGGRVEILANINTSGGLIWVGGAATTETRNGLTVPTGYAESVSMDRQGVLISGATLNSGGGIISIRGLSDDTGNGTQDMGVKIFNSSIQSGAGNLSIYGKVNNDLNNGAGLWIGTDNNGGAATGNVSINSTSGNIYLEGLSTPNNTFSWAHGFVIIGKSGDDVTITSTTGNISLYGDAAVASTLAGEAVGLVVQKESTSSFLNINTDGGEILIRGNSGNTSDDLGLGFRAANIANSIKIGDSNTGNITIQTSSLQTSAQPTFGVIGFESAGTYVFESFGTSFALAVDLTDEYSFATNATGFRFGKVGNTANVRLNTDISVKGPVTVYGGSFEAIQLFSNITSTANGDILIQGNSPESNGWTARLAAGRSISKTAGTGNIFVNGPGRILFEGNITASGTAKPNVVIVAETDNGSTYGIATGNITTNGGHVWIGGGSLTHTWNGLTVGSRWASGGGGGNANAVDLLGNITTSGGDVLITGWASAALDIVALNGSRTISTGSGDITLLSRSSRHANGTNYLNLTTTGVISLAPIIGTAYNLFDLTVTGTTTNGNFLGTDDLTGLIINSISNVGGLVFGNYLGTGVSGDTPYNYANTSITTISNALNINGFIYAYGSGIDINSALTSAATDAAIQLIATAGNANLNANLTTSATGASILTRATNEITSNVGRTFQTNSGDFILWSDSDNLNGGRIFLHDNNIINTTNGSTASNLSGGGRIVLAGGADTNNDGIPDGVATGSHGILLGLNTSNTTSMYSGGGDIIIRGKSTITSGRGIFQVGRLDANAGNGAITLLGESSLFFGIDFNATVSANKQLILTSNKASGTAISITGTSGGNYGVVFNNNAPKELLATGGGNIDIIGTAAVSNTGIFLQDVDILATAGTITLNGGVRGTWFTDRGARFGSKTLSAITSSTANIRIISDVNTFNALSTGYTNNFNTSGTVTIEPFSNSFTSAQTFPISNLTLASTVSGLTIGKSTNTANITLGGATSIAGPINVYAGQIALSSNIQTNSTTTGNVLLQGTSLSGTGNIALAAGRTATLHVGSTSTYDGIISGAGSGLIKSGSGLLILTKDHTYTGSTEITGGDLQVETGGSLSQASSGTLSTTAVSIASGSKFILSPNENVIFTAPISGAGSVEIKGASGAYYNSFLTGTAATIATNSTVLEVLTRITGGMQQGSAITGSQVAGTYHKAYNAANNTATFQFQQFDGMFTKCVFVQLIQSGTNVQIRANTAIYNGAAYRNGNQLGADLSSSSTQMGLATCATCTGYGISNVYMSGKVNFTGNLTYTGNTTLSNTVTSVTSPNTYTYTSKGTQEITDASSNFPTASTVENNGLVIFNRSTPLTIASNMQGTEDVLQVGAVITLTGTNTHSGNTIIDLNKSLIIGDGSTSGSLTGNIINYGSLTFNRSDNSTYSGIISGSGTLTKLGEGSHTLTSLNTYTGATTISAGKLILERNIPATSSSGFSGTGHLVIQPSSASFTNAMTYPIAGFTVASSMGGLTLGKLGNAVNITFGSPTTIAGPITAYGGNIAVNENLNTSAGNANGDILLKASGNISMASSKSITTNGGAVVLWADADGSGAGDIFFASGTSASILTNGGHLWLGGGAGSTTWNGLTVGDGYAVGDEARSINGGTFYNGITIDATNINTGGGHIQMRGKGKAGNLTVGQAIYSGGMYLLRTGTMNSGGGNIDIEAIAQTGSGQHFGFYNFGPYTFNAGTGNLTITGDASASSSGNFNLSGSGIFMWTNASPIVSAGNITLIGKKSTTSGTFGVDIRTPITTTGGNINIEGDALNLVSNLTSNANVILDASAMLTQTGVITADGFALEGAANASIANTANSFNKFAAGTSTLPTGAIKLVNSKTLTVGAVNPTGIYSSGLIEIETTSGDLSITEPIVSTLATGDAIKLYADKDAAAGAAGDGNIIISGSGAVTIETGARALMYSGSESASTGLTALAGGEANKRNNVGATTNLSSVTPSLAANGKFALYRTLSANADLSALAISSGTLTPTFAANTTSYTASVSNATTSITVTPTRAETTATITVNGVAVTSGNASGAINLAVGSNTITTIVRAQDGTTTKTYTVTVTREDVTLPVSLINFTVTAEGERSKIAWSTSSESNNNRFEVEASNDGINFNKIGMVSGTGTSNQVNKYFLFDNHPSNGINYYRLTQFDYNGKRHDLGVKSLSFKIALQMSASVYPNPVEDKINLVLNNIQEKQIKVIMVGINGQQVHQETIDITRGKNEYQIILRKGIPAGLYVLTVYGAELKESIKVFKN